VDGAANSGVVLTDEGVVVIDTQGPKGLAMALRQSLAQVTDSPVIFVVNTHYHGDHTFGNQYFTGGRAIIAHDNARKALIEKDPAHRERFKSFFGEESLAGFNLTPPDVTFSSTLSLRVGGRTFVIVHPGTAHTEGDAYVYMPEEKVVFTGDLLFKGRLPWLGDGDSLGAIAALDKLLALDAEVYVPGHGPVAGRGDLHVYKGYLLDLRKEVKRLKDAGKTLDEVKKEIRLDWYADLLMYDKWLPLNAGKVYMELGGD
jgi:cyclase